jgi:hypothetical protein
MSASQQGVPMKNSTMLSVSSLLSILLFSIHMAFDIVHGVERGDRGDLTGTVLIELVWLYAALLLAQRRSGLILLLLGAILAVAVPAMHMTPTGIGAKYAETSGAVFFFWSLLALGVSGAFSLVLSLRGFWSLRSGQPAKDPS